MGTLLLFPIQISIGLLQIANVMFEEVFEVSFCLLRPL